jgi:hypothetical protein
VLSVNFVSTFRDNIRFGTVDRFHLQGSRSSSPLKVMGPIGSPETSVQSYHCTLRSIPEDRRPQCRENFKYDIADYAC